MITLRVTPLQYDIIKAAIAQYTHNLIQVIEKDEPVTVTVAAAPAPQWGLKKDGTPRARPGRKSVKTRKARA